MAATVQQQPPLKLTKQNTHCHRFPVAVSTTEQAQWLRFLVHSPWLCWLAIQCAHLGSGAVDAEARLQSWALGYRLIGAATFGLNTGRLASLSTSNSAQNFALNHDGIGNIKRRLDAANANQQADGSPARFRYDTLNQLTQANFFEGAQNIAYDGFIRILTKTGVNASRSRNANRALQEA